MRTVTSATTTPPRPRLDSGANATRISVSGSRPLPAAISRPPPGPGRRSGSRPRCEPPAGRRGAPGSGGRTRSEAPAPAWLWAGRGPPGPGPARARRSRARRSESPSWKLLHDGGGARVERPVRNRRKPGLELPVGGCVETPSHLAARDRDGPTHRPALPPEKIGDHLAGRLLAGGRRRGGPGPRPDALVHRRPHHSPAVLEHDEVGDHDQRQHRERDRQDVLDGDEPALVLALGHGG